VIGAALAPPLVAGLAMYVGWRWTFVATAGLGLLLLAVWRKVYFAPEIHPRLTGPERELILAGREAGAVRSEIGDARVSPWRLFTHPLCLCFFAVRFLTDPVAYFFNFWLPDYFGHGRGFTLAMVGMVAWIPYLAGDIGGLGGGAWSDWLIRRGWAPRQARLRVMGTAACLMPVALLAVSTPSVTWAVALIGLLFIGQTAWMANQLSLISECFPRSVAATALSISAMGGSLGGVVATLATGRVVKAYGYGPVFTVMSGLHLTAFVILIVGLRRAQRSVRSGFGP